MVPRLPGLSRAGNTGACPRQSRGGGGPPVDDALPLLLLTRPEPQASRFAADLRARFGPGLTILRAPLMAAEFLDPPLPLDGLAGVVFTAETGVAGLARLTPRRDWPAHCVGAATARAARDAGFAVATEAAGDAAALAFRLKGNAGPLLWPRGEDVAAELPALLPGAEFRQAVVYRQAPRPLTEAALAALAGAAPVVLPLFSPRSARLVAAACPRRAAPLHVAAMSPAVAQAAEALAPARVVVARAPEAHAMLDAVAALIDAARSA